MTDRITFSLDERNIPWFKAEDENYGPIGSLLTSDVQNVEPWCLNLLAWIEDVRNGTSKQESWQGNSWGVLIRPAEFSQQDIYSDWSGSYSLDDAHEVILEYWRFMAPSPAGRSHAIAEWETENGRAHPCRPHL